MKYSISIFFSVFFLLINLSCSVIKEPKLISIENLSISSSLNNNFKVSAGLKVFNPNNFSLKSNDIKIDIYLDSFLVGKAIFKDNFNLKRRDTTTIATEINLDTVFLKQSISLNDTLSIISNGYAKIPFLPANYNFNLNYNLSLNDLLDPILTKNIESSNFKIEEIKLEKVNFSEITLNSLFVFENQFNFDYTIKKIDIEIYETNSYKNLIGSSSLNNTINVRAKSSTDFLTRTSLNSFSLGKTFLKNIFKKTKSLYLKVDAILVFVNIEVPISIQKQVDYNPLTNQIKIL